MQETLLDRAVDQRQGWAQEFPSRVHFTVFQGFAKLLDVVTQPRTVRAVAVTTLIWLYLNWLILLIGSQLAFYHQRPAFLRIGRREPRLSNSVRERRMDDAGYRCELKRGQRIKRHTSGH